MKKFILTGIVALTLAAGTAYAQGCMEASSSASGPQIIGYLQAENITKFLGTDANGNDLTTNTFAFRRARIGVTGNIPYNFSYYVISELSPTLKGPYILDAFLTWKPMGQFFKVSAGQFKSPFGLELSTPCQSLYTIDRSTVVNELASPFRDQGVMFSGGTDTLKIFGLEKANVFTYSLALTNGTGMNVADNNRSKDIIARVAFAPFNFLQIGGSYHYGKQKNPDATVTKPDELTRWGADLQLKVPVGRFGLLSQTEYIYAKDDGSKLVGGGCGATPEVVKGSFKRNGFYSQLLIQTPWKLEPVVKYETYDPNMDLDDNDHTDFRKNTWVMGANYYVNDWTRLQLNYFYNVESSSSTDIAKYNEISNDMLILQVQFLLK